MSSSCSDFLRDGVNPVFQASSGKFFRPETAAPSSGVLVPASVAVVGQMLLPVPCSTKTG